LQTCAPDYPKSCIDEWEKMESCCKKLSSKWEDDPECVALKNETMTKVNTCFATEPHNPLADLEELFMPPGMSGGHRGHGKGPEGKGGASKGESGEKSSKSGDTSDGGKAKEKEDSKSTSKSKDKREAKTNETSSEGDDDEDDSGPPAPPFMMRKECMKTKAQMDCLQKELSKPDPAFQKAVETLLQKKDDCEQKVKHICKLTTGPLKKCFWKAHENLFKKVFEKMATCMKGDGSSGDKGSGGDSTTTSKPKDGGSSNSTSDAKDKSRRK